MSRPKVAGFLIIALAAGALLLGCAAADGTPAPPETPAPQATSLEGRFAFDEMPAFLGAIEPLVARFFDSEFPNLSGPRAVALVARGQARGSPCGAHFQDAYEYCPADQSIYIGQDLLWAFFKVGDAAPAVALAHEWGHHLQSLRRVTPPRTAAQSIAYENQADCIAGAWAKFAGGQGWLEAPDDLEDVGGLLQAIGSREGRGRDHGTAAERSNAFDLGYRDGLRGCNAFATSTPIV